MTTDYAIESQRATEAETTAAQAEAELAMSLSDIKQGARIPDARDIRSVKPMTYRISDADRGAWVMVWELKLDVNGEEYGVPRRAPRQQLGLWLQKRREEDGGVRFTVDQPARVAAEAQFKCLRQDCKKRLYTRQDLVDHMENAHARDARLYRKLLDQILDQAVEDNPRVREMAQAYARMSDRGLVSVETNPVPREEDIDISLGAPVAQSVGGISTEKVPQVYSCDAEGCARFFDLPQGLMMHKKHNHTKEG